MYLCHRPHHHGYIRSAGHEGALAIPVLQCGVSSLLHQHAHDHDIWLELEATVAGQQCLLNLVSKGIGHSLQEHVYREAVLSV